MTSESEKISTVGRVDQSVDSVTHQHLDYTNDQHDDIHAAALLDNPASAERPSLTTVLSILFISMTVVAPIAVGFIVATSILFGIGIELGDTSRIGWVVSAWSIAGSVSLSLAGSLSDIFGRRNVLLVGQVIALVGSIVSATAKDLSTLIAGMTILGFSGGFSLVAYAAVPELCPNKYRPIGIASIEGFLTIPWVALAFLIGNLLFIHASWRWVYWICTIYAGVAGIGIAAVYFPPVRAAAVNGKTQWQQFLELDFVGIFLYMSGLIIFLLGLSWGGTEDHAWSSASVVAPLVLGGLTFIASFVYDFTVLDGTDRHILFPKHLLVKFREFTVSLIVIFVSAMVYYTMSAFLPQATAFIYETDPLHIGVLLLPNGLGQFFATALVPIAISFTGRPKVYLIVAVFCQTIFTGLYAYAVIGHKAAWVAFQFFGAGPFGLIVVTTVLNAGLHVRPSELGIAMGVLGTFRSMGGSVGNAIYGSILRSVSNEELPKRIAAAAIGAGFRGDLTLLIPAAIQAGTGIPGTFQSVPSITPAIEAATLEASREAWAAAFRMVFFATIPFGVIAFAAAFLIKDATEYMTNHTQVHLDAGLMNKHKSEVKLETGV